MAARKRSATKSIPMTDSWRERIRASMLVNRLSDHVEGKVELTPAQVSSANILLKKVAPDLQSVTLTGDEDNPLKVIHALAPELAKKLGRLS